MRIAQEPINYGFTYNNEKKLVDKEEEYCKYCKENQYLNKLHNISPLPSI